MGIDISAKLMLGFDYCTMNDICESENLDIGELLDNDELDCASPWFDADRNNWIVGYEVWGNTPQEVIEAISEGVIKFKDTFGVVPDILVVPDVY